MNRRLAPAALLLLAACGGATDPEWRRVVGVVDVGDGAPGALAVPDTVVAGVPFTATVTTFGSGSCTRPDGAELEVRGSVADIVPYDRDATGPRPCTDDLAPLPRDVRVRFTAPGRALVRVRGRALRGGFADQEVGVVVRP